MRKRLLALLFAACLLTGCNTKFKETQAPKEHAIDLDQLTITLPAEFSPVTVENDDLEFMYNRDKMYIYGYKESKQELIAYMKCDYISLGSYVQTFTDQNFPDANPVQTEDYWSLDYTDTVNEVSYTFVCVFYETEDNFWRVMGCCPTDEYEQCRENLWEYVQSAE